jgi:hypothetical protein
MAQVTECLPSKCKEGSEFKTHITEREAETEKWRGREREEEKYME